MHIHIGACHWQHESWVGQFYPDDLPEDWRLSYYANEFFTVLVPTEVTSQLTLSSIMELCEDVTDRFHFVIAVDDNSGSVFLSNREAELAGCAITLVQLCNQTKQILNNLVEVEQASIIQSQGMDRSIAVLRIKTTDVLTPRQIKQLIEVFCTEYNAHENLFLFFDGQINNVQALRTVQSIIELMGLSA